MKTLLTPFRVGLLVLTAVAFLFVFLTFVKKGGMDEDESVDVYAYFNDASGLGRRSRVQIAGIGVGEIREIILEGNKAKVWLRIRSDVQVREDAALTKRSESIALGDYMLDLFPGTQGARLLKDGDQITRVYDAPGMQQVFDSLQKITGDIQEVTASLRRVLGGDKGTESLQSIVANLQNLSTSVDKTVRESGDKLNAILGNFQEFSEQVRGISRGQEEQIRAIISNINKITVQVQETLTSVQKILGSGEGDLRESVASIKENLNSLQQSLHNIEELTEQVKNGEGIAGKLLADERLGQKVSESVEELSSFSDRLTRLQTEVGIKSEYLVEQGTAKNTLSLRLIPRPDKYYLIEVVDDPRGSVSEEIVVTNPPGVGDPATQRRQIRTEALKFSAQFAKRYYWLTLRFGIIESTGGVGMDASFFDDLLTLKLDAFNFSVKELTYPRLRTSLRLQAFGHLFATAGVDDVLNPQTRDLTTNRLIAGRDYFVGGGIYFTDDDLKAIITTTGVPTP
ncbi:MAG: MCE family protein [Myxococcaceae bacterium]|nr:MCE family protein [Myxococcaceae bacterium]